MSRAKTILVYANWLPLLKPILMGVLSATVSRGKEVFSFEYDTGWLNQANCPVIDPDLQLLAGRYYAPPLQSNFGVFLDSSPDRWGRFLMNRREAQAAREGARPERKLLESDYLLGVYDEHRMGAIRFRLTEGGPFLDNNKQVASPPMASLRELEQASLAIEKKGVENDKEYSRWLMMLIAPGGSLGGARPKASVVDEKKQLWIAKFPSEQDEIDVGAFEMLAYRLGTQSGLTMPEAKIKKFSSDNHTFLTKRFDRAKSGGRIHFASAMTLLQRKDGDDASEGVSYLELAEFIERHGAEVLRDLEQLWRRILFSVCISNVDDHLRNHGFLLEDKGWVLSPAYDINPVAHADGLKLNISETDNALELDLVKQVSPYFRIPIKRAEQIINEMQTVVKRWRIEATRLGISAEEQARMASAFE